MADSPEVQEIDGPYPKRPRRDDADLEIILKFGDGEEKSYLKNATIFCRMSDFFAAALSNNMQERNTGIVTLNDITPEIFEEGIKYLESPTAARRMTCENALKVVEFYNKYQFKEGLELCDDVCSEHIEKTWEKTRNGVQVRMRNKRKEQLLDMVGLASIHNLTKTLKSCEGTISACIKVGAKKRFPDDLDFLIDMTVTAVQGDLKSKKNGIEYLVRRLGNVDEKKAFGVLMFTEERIKKLQPLFKEGTIPRHILPYEMQERGDAIFENPMFPELFVMYTKVDARLNLVEMKIKDKHDPILFVEDDDGDYSNNSVELPGIGRCKLCLQQHDEYDYDWVISSFNDIAGFVIRWHCPGSSKLQYPPDYANAWKTVVRSVKEIEYLAIGQFSNPHWSGAEESSAEDEDA